MLLIRHLRKDRLRDVVVAAPIRSPLSMRELVHVMAPEFPRETSAFSVHLGGARDEVALAAPAWARAAEAAAACQARRCASARACACARARASAAVRACVSATLRRSTAASRA